MPKLETTNSLLTLSCPEKYEVTIKPKITGGIKVSLNPIMKAGCSKNLLPPHSEVIIYNYLLHQEIERCEQETWKQRWEERTWVFIFL